MKLAISNIAWDHADDARMLPLLRSAGVSGIEVAPTKVWPGWEGATPAAAAEYRRRLDAEGLVIPSLQSIVYGKPELQIFEPAARPALLEHFRRVAELAAAMGAGPLVFGAPKHRLRRQLSFDAALSRAIGLLREIGHICESQGVILAWEPNPIDYGCDFITNAADGRLFVDRVGAPGVQLHIDSAGLHMSGGDTAEALRGVWPFVHYHVSEPFLAGPDGAQVDHARNAAVLRDLNYSGWISIEMKQCDDPAIAVSITVQNAKRNYAVPAGGAS